MEKPIDELVALIVNDLDPKLREEFEERAGIMEFDGQLTRRLAESLALLDVLRRHPDFQIEGAGECLQILLKERRARGVATATLTQDE
jgi:hypothetical protein